MADGASVEMDRPAALRDGVLTADHKLFTQAFGFQCLVRGRDTAAPYWIVTP